MPRRRPKNVWEALAGGQSHNVTQNPVGVAKSLPPANTQLPPAPAPVAVAAPSKVKDKHTRITSASRVAVPSTAQLASLRSATAQGTQIQGPGPSYAWAAGPGGAILSDNLGNQVLSTQASSVQAWFPLYLQSVPVEPLIVPPLASNVPVSPQYTGLGQAVGTAGTMFYSYSWFDGTHETQPASFPTLPSISSANNVMIQLGVAPPQATYFRIYADTTNWAPGGGVLQWTVPVTQWTTPISFTFGSLPGFVSTAPRVVSGAGTASTATNTFLNLSPLPVGALRPTAQVDSAGNPYGYTLEGNGRARLVGPTLNVQGWLYEDFFYASQVYPTSTNTGFGAYWVSLITGAASALAPSNLGAFNIGVVDMSTGSTTTGQAGFRTHAGMMTPGGGRFRFSVYFSLGSNAFGPVNTMLFFFGLSSAGSNPATLAMTGYNASIGFQNSSDSTALLTLVVQNNDGGGGARAFTAVDVGGNSISLAVGVFHFCEFEVNAAATTVDWWVDQVKQTQINASSFTGGVNRIPITSMGINCQLQKTATGGGTASRDMQIDAVSFYEDFVS